MTVLMSLLAIAGCDAAPPARDAAAVAAPARDPASPQAAPAKPIDHAVTDGWIGRWVGVEGLVLAIARGDLPATYRLHIILMDGAEDHVGVAQGETIRFERDGEPQVIRHVTGDRTGLKWLADKRDCLVIRPGEGFCRD
ncbi:MAG: hypothetical protein ABW173_05640 [Sphingomonas sp.]